MKSYRKLTLDSLGITIELDLKPCSEHPQSNYYLELTTKDTVNSRTSTSITLNTITGEDLVLIAQAFLTLGSSLSKVEEFRKGASSSVG